MSLGLPIGTIVPNSYDLEYDLNTFVLIFGQKLGPGGGKAKQNNLMYFLHKFLYFFKQLFARNIITVQKSPILSNTVTFLGSFFSNFRKFIKNRIVRGKSQR